MNIVITERLLMLFCMGKIFKNVLISKGFVELHTPKLIVGASEVGSFIFKMDYKGQPGFLS